MSAPRLPSIFKNIRTNPKGFNYVPRYYDERKEKLEKRIRIIEKEVALEDHEKEIAKVRIQSKLRDKFEETSRHHVDHGRTLRLLIIVALLLAIGSVLFSYLDL